MVAVIAAVIEQSILGTNSMFKVPSHPDSYSLLLYLLERCLGSDWIVGRDDGSEGIIDVGYACSGWNGGDVRRNHSGSCDVHSHYIRIDRIL
jgi:hypothetical protein